MSSTGPTLLILAAGMGSRFGGLKQLAPLGPNGEPIIDYSLYDALQAGFKKIVFIIRESFDEDFRTAFLPKLEGKAEAHIVYQEMGACLGDYSVPADREKPWGTGHAILVAKDIIQEPFAVINADDYYGPSAYQVMANHLNKLASEDNTAVPTYAMVGYQLRKTLSEHGTVNRGLCECDAEGFLKSVVERYKIAPQGDGAVYEDEAGKQFPSDGNELASMNLWGFSADIMERLNTMFQEFLAANPGPKDEFFIPTAVQQLIDSDKARVSVLPTEEQWFGLTYKEDAEMGKSRIERMISEGAYPKTLWQE